MATRVRHPQKLGSRLDQPPACDISLIVGFDGWLQDLLRLHASLRAHLDTDWEMVVVDNPVDEEASEAIVALDRVVHVPLAQQMGYAGARNLGLRLSSGRLACIVDTSVELTGDLASPLGSALADEHVGLVGRWGVTSANGFDFDESDGPDVDGVEAYLMAARRDSWAQVGLFDPKFKWYRNADLDQSFRFRDAGYSTIVHPGLPVVRHEHRLWAATGPDERDKLSRTNFWRFRDHWGEREDLFVARSS